jgi:hypothetical protein
MRTLLWSLTVGGEKMSKLVWRIRFAFAVRKIFSKPKGAFTGNHLKLGWKVSGDKYDKYKGIAPCDAALEEIGEWYDL